MVPAGTFTLCRRNGVSYLNVSEQVGTGKSAQPFCISASHNEREPWQASRENESVWWADFFMIVGCACCLPPWQSWRPQGAYQGQRGAAVLAVSLGFAEADLPE